MQEWMRLTIMYDHMYHVGTITILQIDEITVRTCSQKMAILGRNVD
jgi:hypothetical protein